MGVQASQGGRENLQVGAPKGTGVRQISPDPMLRKSIKHAVFEDGRRGPETVCGLSLEANEARHARYRCDRWTNQTVDDGAPVEILGDL